MPRRQVYYRKNLSWWQRFTNIIADKHTWLSIVYMTLQLPLGITYFTVLVTLIALSLWGIAIPILQLGYDIPVSSINGVSYYIVNWMLPVVVVAGIVMVVMTMHLARYIGRMHGALAKTLLVRR